MSITIHTEPLAYTEFRDFIISSANWFVPSLLQMPNLDEWILKMYHNGGFMSLCTILFPDLTLYP